MTNNSLQYTLNICYDEKHTEESVNTEFLSLQNNHLNWKNDIDQTIPKFSTACYT
jgi:hypothetical protein